MTLFGHNAALGFWLHDGALDAALIWPKRKGWKVAGQATAQEGGFINAPDRRERLIRAFRQCVRKLPRTSRRADLGAVLAVPDGCVEEDALGFAEFPTAQKEAHALVSHRMARELGVSTSDITVSWDVFVTETGTTCRVRAINNALRDDLEAAAASAGLRLTRIESWAGVASGAPEFRDFSDGAAVWSDGTEWSLLCWTKNDPIGFSQQGTLGARTAEDVIRLSQSYALSQGLEVLDLVLDAPPSLVDAVSAQAHSAGVPLRRFATEASRSERVAAWG